jgi:hypothetical protein
MENVLLIFGVLLAVALLAFVASSSPWFLVGFACWGLGFASRKFWG